jgi:hypothetical protein
MLNVELNGKVKAAPIGDIPLESIETNGVTSTVGDDTCGAGAGVASCALAETGNAHPSATIARGVRVNLFMTALLWAQQ